MSRRSGLPGIALAGVLAASACAGDRQMLERLTLPGGGEVEAHALPVGVPRDCLLERMVALVETWQGGQLLPLRVRLQPGHSLLDAMQREPRVEYTDERGDRLFLPFAGRRLFSRSGAGQWRAWEVPPDLALENCRPDA